MDEYILIAAASEKYKISKQRLYKLLDEDRLEFKLFNNRIFLIEESLKHYLTSGKYKIGRPRKIRRRFK